MGHHRDLNVRILFRKLKLFFISGRVGQVKQLCDGLVLNCIYVRLGHKMVDN